MKAPVPREEDMHRALARILDTCLEPGWIYNHIPSGELRNKAVAGKLKGMGHKPGWFDFVLIGPRGGHYYLELKRATGGRLSPAQLQFMAELHGRGIPFAVCVSLEDAIGILRDWRAVVRVRIAA